MDNEDIKLDIEKLRKDLKTEAQGAYFGGGYGGALIESFDIERASPEELIEIAKNKDIDLREYTTERNW